MANTKISATAKCPHCRQPLPDGSRFCLFCGAPVGSPGTTTGPEPDSERHQHRPPSPPAETSSGSTSTDAPVQPSAGSHRSLLTLGFLAMLIGGAALAAYGLVSATGGGGEEAPGVRPLARAGLGVEEREVPPDASGATTDTLAPQEEPQPGSGSGEPEDGGSPPATGIASPAQALAAAFGLAEGETAVPCSAADFDDALCYIPYLTNLEQGRYLYQVGLPFSEPVAWALVEQQGDGTFQTTQTADFDFEGDGTPPFSPGGPMAGITFTSELLDERPIDRLDDGSNPAPAGTTEVYVFIRYTGLAPSDEATVTLDRDGSPLSEPMTVDVNPGGKGSVTLLLARDDGAEISAGAYTATVLLNGAAIVSSSMAVAGA